LPFSGERRTDERSYHGREGLRASARGIAALVALVQAAQAFSRCNGLFGSSLVKGAETRDNASVLRWWRAFRESLRAGSRIGRVFGLRDRGRLDEALQQGLSLAEDLFASDNWMVTSTLIVCAATIDEVAQRLNRPQEAESVLRRAVAVIEREQASGTPRIPRKPGDWHSTLASYHRQFRDQLNVIASARNPPSSE
jgi:hypothetical protein